MESKQINSVPVIIGTNRNEGGSMIRSKSEIPQMASEIR
jgi:carboxylesterase type B